MNWLPAISLPDLRQGSRPPCRVISREIVQGIDDARVYAVETAIFDSESRFSPCQTGLAGRNLGGGADCGFFDLAADEWLVFAEIGLEAAGQPACGLVIGLLIRPGAARVEDLIRHLGAALRHEQAEIGVLPHRRRGEAAVEGGAQQGAGVRDWHA